MTTTAGTPPTPRPAPAPRTAAGSCRRRAFTLLELVLVMILICTALAIAAPQLSGFLGGSKQRDTAMQLTALARWARTQAISEGRVYRLNLADGGKTYFVTAQNGTDFVQPDNPDMGQQFTTPDNVAITFDRTDVTATPAGDGTSTVSVSGPADHADFFPDGRCDPGTFKVSLTNRDDMLVTCTTPTEQYRVVPPSEMNRP